MSLLSSPAVKSLLDRLYESADREDPSHLARFQEKARLHHGPLDDAERAQLLKDAYLPVDRSSGRFLYTLARMRDADLVVEFGTSFGISTIHLAAAIRDNGHGRVITTEMEPGKASQARRNLAEAGLDNIVELRQGDAFETLRTLEGPVDMVFLDGWKQLYLPMLHSLESRLSPGAVVIADDLQIMPDVLRPYLEYVRDPRNGYTSVEIPLGDGMELSLLTARINPGTASRT